MIKTSEDIHGVDASIAGISWDGTDTPWSGFESTKLYLTSGQFSSVIKTSEAIGGIDTIPTDICTNDVNARLGEAPPPPDGVIIFRRRIEGE